jgi:hypothetical protein
MAIYRPVTLSLRSALARLHPCHFAGAAGICTQQPASAASGPHRAPLKGRR